MMKDLLWAESQKLHRSKILWIAGFATVMVCLLYTSVTGAEKEEYIRVAMEKAHHLKDFVTALFDWVKLDAGEQIFHFEVCDLNELSRDIMADWVPLLDVYKRQAADRKADGGL